MPDRSRDVAQKLIDYATPENIPDDVVLTKVIAAIASPVGDANLSRKQIQEILDRMPQKGLTDEFPWVDVFTGLAKQPELSDDQARELLNRTTHKWLVGTLAHRPNLTVDLIQVLLDHPACNEVGFVDLARQANLSGPQVGMLRQRAGAMLAMSQKYCRDDILASLKSREGNRDDGSARSPKI